MQLRLSYASLEVSKQLAEQQREDALATVTELEGQLADIGAEIATHMQVGGAAALCVPVLACLVGLGEECWCGFNLFRPLNQPFEILSHLVFLIACHQYEVTLPVLVLMYNGHAGVPSALCHAGG